MAFGKAREGWDLDFSFGKIREAVFEKLLRSKRVECKSNPKCRETGNVAFEFQQRGRPSGLAKTEAEFYGVEFAQDCWLLVPTAKIKDICARAFRFKDERGNKPYIKMGGDFNQYANIVIPVTELVAQLRLGEWIDADKPPQLVVMPKVEPGVKQGKLFT